MKLDTTNSSVKDPPADPLADGLLDGALKLLSVFMSDSALLTILFNSLKTKIDFKKDFK